MPRSAQNESVAKHFSIRVFAAKRWDVAYFISSPTRVGRSQGVTLFWGLISVCFAFAACFYYVKNIENERIANQASDQVSLLREENQTLSSEKAHLESSRAEAESQLNTREQLVQDKEAQLAQEETTLEGMGRQAQNQTQQNLAQVVMVKKFNDVIRKIGKDTPPDVVERGGRPVLRVPNTDLFAPGDTALKPEGKALLSQIAQAISGQLGTFELRVVTYTDTEAEAQSPDSQKKDASADPRAASWNLTSQRAATLSRFLRDQTEAPFLNVLVIGRGDAEPIVSNTGDGHARNRRVEITVTPLPVPFHSPDLDKPDHPVASATPAKDSTDSSTTAKKDKKTDKTAGH